MSGGGIPTDITLRRRNAAVISCDVTLTFGPRAGERCGKKHIARPHGGQACSGHILSGLRKGEPCGRLPIDGAGVCPYHGGILPAVRKHAARVVADRQIAAALAQFEVPAKDVDPAAALTELISWTHARWCFYRTHVLALEPMDYVWGITQEKTGGEDWGTTYSAGETVWVKLLRETERDLAQMCVAALKVGIKQQALDNAMLMSDKFMPMMLAVLEAFGIDAKAPENAPKIDRALRLVG